MGLMAVLSNNVVAINKVSLINSLYNFPFMIIFHAFVVFC